MFVVAKQIAAKSFFCSSCPFLRQINNNHAREEDNNEQMMINSSAQWNPFIGRPRKYSELNNISVQQNKQNTSDE